MKDEGNNPQGWVRGSPNNDQGSSTPARPAPVSGMALLEQVMGCPLPVRCRPPRSRMVLVAVIVVLLFLLLSAYLFGG